MAVRRGKRRGRRQTPPPSAQKSWYNLVASLGALVMVLALGDQFASSAAGCYGAVAHSQEETPEDLDTDTTISPEEEPSPAIPVFRVKEPDTDAQTPATAEEKKADSSP